MKPKLKKWFSREDAKRNIASLIASAVVQGQVGIDGTEETPLYYASALATNANLTKEADYSFQSIQVIGDWSNILDAIAAYGTEIAMTGKNGRVKLSANPDAAHAVHYYKPLRKGKK